MVEEVTFTVSGPDGDDEFTVPEGLVDLLAEEDDESQAQVVADLALMSFAQRAHMIAHHGEGELRRRGTRTGPTASRSGSA